MGLSITKLASPTQPQRIGQRMMVEADVGFDNSYLATGESLTPGDLGLTKITSLESEPSADGRIFTYNYAAQKLLAWQAPAGAGAFVEVPNATNLQFTFTRIRAYGH